MIKERKKVIGALAAVMAVSLAAGAVLGLSAREMASADRGGDDAWVTIDEIYNDDASRFKAGELRKLYQVLAGSDAKTLTAVQSALDAKSGALTSADFRNANGESKNVSVTFGGKKWDAVYLTTATNGDVILDLWRSADTLTLDDVAVYSDWYANTTTNNYPSNMYSTSRIRVDTLNAGGKYSTSGSALTEHEQTESNQYARFTMSDVGNSLTQYLAKPSDVGYQADEWDEATAASVNSGKYYFPNDAYGEPQGGQWYNDNYNYLANDRDTGREEGAKYGSWKDDYLWLPSLTETGTEDGNGDGIWDTDVSLRSALRGSAHNYYWLRSGEYNRPDRAYIVYDSGASAYSQVGLAAEVRPALHLNLTAAARTALPMKDDWQGDSKTYAPNGVTWVLENTENVTITAVAEEGGDTSWWNEEDKTIKATKVGTYQIQVTPKEGLKWEDATGNPNETITVTYTVTPADMTVTFNGDHLAKRRDVVYESNMAPIPLKLPEPTEKNFPIVWKGVTWDADTASKISIQYIVKKHDEAEHDDDEIENYLKELQSGQHAGDWKDYNDLEDKTALQPMGYVVYFKATDTEGNHNQLINYFGIHIAAEELDITLTPEARAAFMQGVEYGDVTHNKDTFEKQILDGIDKIMAPNADPSLPDIDRTEDFKANIDNFTFYLRKDNEKTGDVYTIEDDGVHIYKEGLQPVAYLPLGTYYLYVAYTEPPEDAEDASDYITFAWPNGRPSFEVMARKITVTLTFTDTIYGQDPEGWVKASAARTTADASGEWYAPIDAPTDGDGFDIFERSYSLQGAKGGDPLTSSTHPGKTTPADTYTVTPTWTNENYEVTFAYTSGQNYTVKQREITAVEVANIVWTNAEGHPYNGRMVTPSATLTVDGNVLRLTVKIAGDNEENTTFRNVDHYTFTADLREANKQNYKFVEGVDLTKTAEITPAKLTLTWAAKTFTYTGAVIGIDEYPTVTVSGRVDGEDSDEVDVTIAPDKEFQNAGTYTFKATLVGTEAGNYVIDDGYDTHDYTIDKAELTVTANDKTITYGDAPSDSGVEYSGFKGDDNKDNANITGEVTFTFDYEQYDDVGDYQIIPNVEGLTADNYTFKAVNGTLTVNKKEISVTVTVPENHTYGNIGEFKATFAEGDIVNSDDVKAKMTFSGTPNKGTFDTGETAPTLAGSYSVWAAELTGTKAKNYTITNNGETSFTIERASVEVTWSNTNGHDYDGSEFDKPKATAEGVNGDELTLTVDFDESSSMKDTFKNAGDYVFKATISDDNLAGNYTLTNDKTSTITITKKSVTAPSSFDPKTYNGAEQTVDLEEGVDYKLKEGTGKGKDAGKYDVTLELKDTANYMWSDTKGSDERTLTEAFEIEKAKITVEWSGTDNQTYRGSAYDLPTATPAEGDVQGSDEVTLTVSIQMPEHVTEFKNAGTYTFKATLDAASEKNYYIDTESETHSYTIGKAELTVKANDKTITYGDAPSDSGVTYSGFVGNDNQGNVEINGEVTFTYNYKQYDDVGGYQIIPNVEGLTAENYTFKAESGTLTVNKKEISVTVTVPESHTYGNIGEFKAEFAEGDIVNSDDVQAKMTFSGTPNKGTFLEGETAPTLAGSYSVWAAELTGTKAKNYTITNNGETSFTIERASVEVEWSGKDGHVYSGSEFDKPTATAEGVNGDELTLTVDFDESSSMKDTFKNAGDYVFKATISDEDLAGNYTLTNDTTDTITITKKPVTAPSSFTPKTYNGAEQTVDLEEGVDYKLKEETGKGKDAGKYDVTLQLKDADNYMWSDTEGSNERTLEGAFEIEKAKITSEIEWGGVLDSYSYKGSAYGIPTATVKGVGSATLTLTVTMKRHGGIESSADFKDAEVYVFEAGLSEDAQKNYAFEEGVVLTKEIEISPMTVTVTWEEKSYTYNGTDLTFPTATANGVDGEGALTLTIAISEYAGTDKHFKNAGKYTFQAALDASDAKNKNYRLNEGTKEKEYTVDKANMGAVFNDDDHMLKSSTHVYRSDMDAIKLKLPDPTDSAFPITWANGSWKDANITIYYIITTHEEGIHSGDTDAEIAAYLKRLKEGENSELWKVYSAEDGTMNVKDPKGYCVYFKIVDEDGNHNDFYDYFSVHIAHEELSITLTDEARQGLMEGVEYGDFARTKEHFEQNIVSGIDTIKSAGDTSVDRETFVKNIDNFTFYLRKDNEKTGDIYTVLDDGIHLYKDGSSKVTNLPVGTYWIYVTYKGDIGGGEVKHIEFTWERGRPSFTVSPRKITIELTFESHVYGDSNFSDWVMGGTPTRTTEGASGTWYAPGEAEINLGLTYSLETVGTPTATTDAGTYSVVASYKKGNYEVTFVNAAGGELTYTIAPKEIGVTWEFAESYTYTGSDLEMPTATASGLDGDNFTLIVSIPSGVAFKNAGEYTFTAALDGSDPKTKNYILIAAQTTSKTVTVDPAKIEVVWDTQNRVYKGSAFDLPTATATGFGGDTFTLNVVMTKHGAETGSADFEHAGSYTFEAKFETDDPKSANYILTGIEKTYDIAKATNEWTVDPSLDNWSYDGGTGTHTPKGTAQFGEVTFTYSTSEKGVFTAAQPTDAGAYYLKATVADTSDYDGLTLTVQFTISPKEVAVAWSAAEEYVYNGNEQTAPSASAAGVGGVELTLTLTASGTFKNAGSYTFTAALSDETAKNNYVLTGETLTIAIAPKEVSVTWEDKNYTYTGLEIGDLPTASATGVGSDGTLTVTVALDDPSQTFRSAGSYTFLASLGGEEAQNYTLANATKDYMIGKAALTVTAKDHTITYGDALSDSGVEYRGFVNGEDAGVLGGTLNYSYDYEQYGDIGNYTITPSGLSSENYDIQFAAGTLTVVAKSVTVVITVPENLTYNDIGEFAAEVQGLVNGDEVTATLTFNGTPNDGSPFSDSATKPTLAGSYTVKATGLTGEKAKNYTMTADDEETFTIGRAIVTKPTADTNTYTYNGKDQTYTVQGGDSTHFSVEGNVHKDANESGYKVTVSLTDKDNYMWADSEGSTEDLTFDFIIQKAPLTVTAKNHTITYGDSPSGSGVEYSGFVNGEGAGVLGGTLNCSYNYKQYGDIGSYTITPSGLSSENYDIQFAAGTLTVVAKSVTVVITVPENLIYNDIGEFTAEVQGLVNGDEVTATLTFNGKPNDGSALSDSATKPTLAGSYTVKATGLTGEKAKNYTMTADGEKTFTIEKATAAGPAKDGRTFTYTGVEQEYTVSRSDLYAVSGNKQTNAGSYKVTISLADKNNYKWKETDSSDDLSYDFVIGKAPLTVTAKDHTITYGDAPSDSGVEYSGFVNGEGVGVLGGTLHYSYDYTRYGDIGNYTITPSGYTSSNYNIQFVAGKLTVAPFEISAEWSRKSYTYTGSVFTDLPTATAAGIGGDGTFALKVTLNDATRTFKNAGEYIFKAELDSSNAKAKNYALKADTATHSYTVEKQEVTAPTIASKVYSGAKQTADVAPSTLYNVTENDGGTNVGSYGVELTLADSANYKWADSETAETVLTFTITKATYDLSGVTFEDLTLKYDAKEHSIEIKGTLPNGVTVTYEGNGRTDPGEYTVTANFKGDDQNYHPIPSMTAVLKILAISHDLSEVGFEDVTVKYDGNAHSITVTGTLPANVTVTYEGNGQTDPNIYTVTAIFSDPDGVFERKTATLTILRTHTQFDHGEGTAEVIVDSEDGFDPALELVVEKAESIERSYWAWEKDKISERYAVKMCKDGEEVPIDGKVTVRILIPEEFRDKDFELVAVSRATSIEYARDGDYVVFESDGLSAYVFTSTYVPYIPVIIILVAVLFVDVLVMTALVVVYKKRKKTTEE